MACLVDTLNSGASLAITIVVTPNQPGIITNTPTVTTSSTDPVAANNSVAQTTTVTNPILTFTVTNTNDSGSGSLRQAILDANTNTGATDVIRFNIPGAAPHTIAPTSALPTITDPVVIDATTQPDFAGSPVVELTGVNASTATGLTVTGGNTTVRGSRDQRVEHRDRHSLGRRQRHRGELRRHRRHRSGAQAEFDGHRRRQ